MLLPLAAPPKSLCLLRLSAVGDITHTMPIVHTLRKYWPETQITWVIGKTEHSLVYDIPDIEFITFDKSKKWRAYLEYKKQIRGRQFDVLLHMQMSLRSSMLNLLTPATIKLGFDKQRAKDMQWLFTNAKIAYKHEQHVIDSFFGFTEALGIPEHEYSWDIPVPPEAQEFAQQHMSGKPALVISPCSSMDYRNWNVAGYAALADYA
ncbi:MAG: glycosyltransferase family 9 protein, partial [Gammaproteobacteria bacterium]|nr:glycosyltransferase family 9 protein [Gammaproteobacteria bacterium]